MDDTLLILVWIFAIVPGALLVIKIQMDRGKKPKPTKKKETPKPEPPKEIVVAINDAPKKFPFEMVREVSGNSNPVVIKRKMINRSDEIILWPRLKPLPRAYFIKSVIKRETEVPNYVLGFIRRGTKKRVDFIARCNQYWSETLSSLTESKPKFSRELENLLFGDDETQMIAGVANIQKFILDSTMLKLMLIVFAMSIPFGFLMDTILNIIPHQIVIWSP